MINDISSRAFEILELYSLHYVANIFELQELLLQGKRGAGALLSMTVVASGTA